MSYKKQLTKKDNYRNKKDPAYLMLTPMQEKFCYEYIIDRNAMQAAIRAGFSKKTSHVQATRIMKNPYVIYKINRLLEEQHARIGITADNVLKELMKLAFVDITDIFDENGNLKDIGLMPENVRKAIASVEVSEEFDHPGKDKERIGYTKKIKFWPKDKALELLAKHLKLLGDSPLIPPGSVLIFGDITIEDIKKQDVPTLLGNINNRLAQQYQKQ